MVHARGAGAHGYFKLLKPIPEYSTAGILNDSERTTPMFARCSTVQGSRGSADTVRDVRGFALKFYTKEGNWDIVGNNIPVFFIQDAIKFPDFVHAVKPEPHNEIPQGQTAHNNFWDFQYLHPEATHVSMWAMSDRAIPRSFRMMQGFGVNSSCCSIDIFYCSLLTFSQLLLSSMILASDTLSNLHGPQNLESTLLFGMKPSSSLDRILISTERTSGRQSKKDSTPNGNLESKLYLKDRRVILILTF